MAPEYRHLFSSLRVGGLALKNRVFSSGQDGRGFGERVSRDHVVGKLALGARS
jgi:hypothetical protein